MSRKVFTKEQQELLRQNPYVYSVSASCLKLTKEFKELFMKAYNNGDTPRAIMENYGFDIGVIGDRRVWSISLRIRAEYQKYGEFREGYRRRPSGSAASSSEQPLSEKDELRLLRYEVDYLKQEMEFLKKISSIRNTEK